MEAVTISRCPRCNSKNTLWYPYERYCMCKKCSLVVDPMMMATHSISPLEFWYYPKDNGNIDDWARIWHEVDNTTVPFGVDPLEYVRYLDAQNAPGYKRIIMDERLNAYIHSIWETKKPKQKLMNNWVNSYSAYALKMTEKGYRDDFINTIHPDLLEQQPYKGMLELIDECLNEDYRRD